MGPFLLPAFLVAFVAGPALAALLLRLPASPRVVGLLGVAVLACLGLAMILRGETPLATLVSLWLGWVLAVAMVALALRRRRPAARRWTTLGAILACPLPWFGLATANMMD